MCCRTEKQSLNGTMVEPNTTLLIVIPNRSIAKTSHPACDHSHNLYSFILKVLPLSMAELFQTRLELIGFCRALGVLEVNVFPKHRE